MSKLTRESIEKAEKLLAKREGSIETGARQEIAEHLARSSALAAELKQLKDAAKEKRLDIEDNARALARITRKARKTAEAAEAAQKADAKTARKSRPTEPRRGAAPREKAAGRRAATESAPSKPSPDA
jgi:hypothetical protein